MSKLVEKSSDYVKVCGFNVYSKDKRKCLDNIFQRKKVHIVSGNPEVIYTAMNNNVLEKNFKSEDSIIIPDGIGTKLAAKLNGDLIEEKIAGIELMLDIIEKCEKDDKSIYLLGASSDSLASCKKALKDRFPKLNICGSHDGYFDWENTNTLVSEIGKLKPYAIFVAMGCPKQEELIINHLFPLDVSICMGVGGSFDVIGGTKKRAPKMLINMGLEWAYRVLSEPSRVVRLIVIPKLLLKAYKFKEN